MAYDLDAYEAALEVAKANFANCISGCDTDFCEEGCATIFKDAIKDAYETYGRPDSPTYGAVGSEDLLVVGRGGTSYQVKLGESGLASLGDTKAAEEYAITVSSGLVSDLESSTTTELASEAEARALADSTETEARILADNTEATAREEADLALEALINNSLDFALYDELP